jgi:hypothetical protein
MYRILLFTLIVGPLARTGGQESDWREMGYQLDLLSKSEVRKELQLDKGQEPELFGEEAFRAAGREATKGLKPGSPEYMKALRAAMAAARPRRLTPLDLAALRGEQYKRLEQLSCQWQFARDPWTTLRDKGILNGLGKGQDQLLELQHARGRELAKLINEHRTETGRLLLEELSLERQRKWKSISGEEFQFKSPPYELRLAPPGQVPREFRQP